MTVQPQRRFPVGNDHNPPVNDVTETESADEVTDTSPAWSPALTLPAAETAVEVQDEAQVRDQSAPPAQQVSNQPATDVSPAPAAPDEPKAPHAAKRRKSAGAHRLPLPLAVTAAMLLLIGVAVKATVSMPDLAFGLLLMFSATLLLVSTVNTRVFHVLVPPKHPVPDRVPSIGPSFKKVVWNLGGRWLYRRIGWHPLVTLSTRERERRADDELWELRKVQKTYAVVNTKGDAGKTTITAWLAGIASKASRRHIIAFDVNESPGGTAKRFGIDRKDTLKLRAYLANCQALWSYSRLMKVVEWQRHSGVTVIASDETSTRFKLYDCLRGLWKLTEHSKDLFTDLGNAILAEGNLGSMIMCDTVISVASVTSPDSFDDLASTHRIFGELGFTDKIKKGVVFILGAKQSERAAYAEQYGFPVSRVFVVPNDKYMRESGVVDLTKIGRLTRVELKEGLIAANKAAPANPREYDPKLIPMDPDSALALTANSAQTEEVS